ncbi:Uncharacterised protein [Vibrio cholerae]|nr:Uncharacterised protein [Vibrio cholerae]CSD16114.1 Uncharacterised protein [Vibrio cholerae]
MKRFRMDAPLFKLRNELGCTMFGFNKNQCLIPLLLID